MSSSSHWLCTGCSTHRATPSSGTPGTRRTRTSCVTGRQPPSTHCASPEGCLVIPPARSRPARLGRTLPRLHGSQLRPRNRDWVPPAGGERPSCRRGRRRRRAHGRHGVRGTEQPRAIGCPVIIVFNDNGRSYAPTISTLSSGLTYLRLNPSYVHARRAAAVNAPGHPGLGGVFYSGMHGLTSALREIVTPHRFFEVLGVRYAGPIDGHDIAGMEQAFAERGRSGTGRSSSTSSPRKGADMRRRRTTRFTVCTTSRSSPSRSQANERCRALVHRGVHSSDPEGSRAPTRDRGHHRRDAGSDGSFAFPGGLPGSLLRCRHRRTARCHGRCGDGDGGLRPVVAVYSTFFSRAFDQANLDVGLHGLPVVFALDRSGVTGDDGPSHHGILDMSARVCRSRA